MIPVEITLAGRGMKENGRGGEFLYICYILRISVNATPFPHPAQ
jgi:hypothetical protein